MDGDVGRMPGVPGRPTGRHKRPTRFSLAHGRPGVLGTGQTDPAVCMGWMDRWQGAPGTQSSNLKASEILAQSIPVSHWHMVGMAFMGLD